jgi:phage FluMu gp28-like protein
MRLALGLALLDGFERGLVRIPPDPRRRADLRAIKRAATSGGGVRLVNDDSVHADYFWALAMAFYLSQQPLMQIDYRPAGRAAAAPGGRRRLSMRPNYNDDLPPLGGRSTW